MSKLKFQKLNQTDENISSATQLWYSQLGDNVMSSIYTSALQPFPEEKSLALEFYQALAGVAWGQKNLRNQAGFMEYILDRSTEQTKEGKAAKFDVVKTLVQSPSSKDIFGERDHQRLVVHHNEGPYYILVETNVALEEGS